MVNSFSGVFVVPEDTVSYFYCQSIFTLGMALECAGANPERCLKWNIFVTFMCGMEVNGWVFKVCLKNYILTLRMFFHMFSHLSLRKGLYVWSIHIFNFYLFISMYDQSNLFWSSCS